MNDVAGLVPHARSVRARSPAATFQLCPTCKYDPCVCPNFIKPADTAEACAQRSALLAKPGKRK